MERFSIDFEKCTIREVILHWAKSQPGAPALESHGNGSLSYPALASVIDDVRNSLNAAGLGRGDRVGITHSGGAGMLSASLGAMCSATAVPLNDSFQKEECLHHLQACGVRALMIEEGMDCAAREAANELGIPCLEILDADGEATGKVRLRGVDGTAPRAWTH